MFQTVLASLSLGFLKSLEIFALTLFGRDPARACDIARLDEPVQAAELFCQARRVGHPRHAADAPASADLLRPRHRAGQQLSGAAARGGRFLAAMVAFIFNYACYFSEIFRGGIEGVPRGQREAGQVLGMTNTQIFFKVTLMQVIKRIVPPMATR